MAAVMAETAGTERAEDSSSFSLAIIKFTLLRAGIEVEGTKAALLLMGAVKALAEAKRETSNTERIFFNFMNSILF
jgi:hypothetical protein